MPFRHRRHSERIILRDLQAALRSRLTRRLSHAINLSPKAPACSPPNGKQLKLTLARSQAAESRSVQVRQLWLRLGQHRTRHTKQSSASSSVTWQNFGSRDQSFPFSNTAHGIGDARWSVRVRAGILDDLQLVFVHAAIGHAK